MSSNARSNNMRPDGYDGAVNVDANAGVVLYPLLIYRKIKRQDRGAACAPRIMWANDLLKGVGFAINFL